MSLPEDETAWLYEYIVNMFNAPTWQVPLSTFIDSKCEVFEPGEENKFCYTDVHKEYCALVERLLEEHLAEIGLSSEAFVSLCGKSQTSPFGSAVLELILAADDFLVFKGIMCRRNAELEMEAMRALQAQGYGGYGSYGGQNYGLYDAGQQYAQQQYAQQQYSQQYDQQYAPAGQYMQPGQYAHALPDRAPSPAEAPAVPAARPPEAIREESELQAALAASAAVEAAKEKERKDAVTLEDEELRLALAASLMDAEDKRRQAEWELAMLEAAIAASLALEQERKRREEEEAAEAEARLLKLAKEREMQRLRELQLKQDTANAAVHAAAANEDPASPGRFAGEAAGGAGAAPAKAAGVVGATGAAGTQASPCPVGIAQLAAAGTSISSPAVSSASATAAGSSAQVSAAAAPAVSAPASPAASGSAHHQQEEKGEIPEDVTRHSLPRVLPPLMRPRSIRASSLMDMTFHAPLSPSAGSAMDSLADGLEAAQRNLQSAREAEDGAAKMAGVSEADLRRRQEYLRKQRDLLVNKRVQEGQAALDAATRSPSMGAGSPVKSSQGTDPFKFDRERAKRAALALQSSLQEQDEEDEDGGARGLLLLALAHKAKGDALHSGAQ